MKKIRSWGLLGVLLLASAVMLSGLTASAAEMTPADTTKAAEGAKLVPIVNPTCPVMGTVMEKTAPENMTRMFKGQRVGFCCEVCLKKWDAMNDAERDVAFKEAMKPGKK